MSIACLTSSPQLPYQCRGNANGVAWRVLFGEEHGYMAAARASMAGYAEEAAALIKQYERISFAEAHRQVLHLMPVTPGRVLDIGAGTGRDAAALATMGHSVLAVEPTEELRR